MQFVQRSRDGAQFAVKFFFSRSGYQQELGHYTNRKLAGLLIAPLLVTANEDRSIVSDSGYVFPPMIVTERGEVCPSPACSLPAINARHAPRPALRPLARCWQRCGQKLLWFLICDDVELTAGVPRCRR